jgi:hypothetical protein
MGDGFVVDVDELRDVARALRATADELADSPKPGPAPDAGATTAELARVLSALGDARDVMAEAIGYAAGNLDRCATDYTSIDEASEQRLLRLVREAP